MWWQLASAAVGVWLTAAPDVVGYAGAARTTHQIAGPLTASFAFVAAWEVLRPLRWLNLPIGLSLVAAAWLLGADAAATWHGTLAGLLLGALATRGGRVEGRYGSGWRAVLRDGRGA